MLPALARVEDLAVRIGVSGAQIDDARAQAALDDASTLARAEVGLTWVVVDSAGVIVVPAVLLAEELIPDVVAFVVLSAAARAYQNPSGIIQKTAGDVAVAYSKPAGTGVYLTDDERALLRGAASPSSTGLFSLATYRGDLCDDTVWIPVVGAPPFPWLTTEDV